jgi:hypothetical protein
MTENRVFCHCENPLGGRSNLGFSEVSIIIPQLCKNPIENYLQNRKLWYIIIMFRFPKIERKAFSAAAAGGPSDEKEYWLSKSPGQRLQAVELMRQIIYGYNPSTQRLQRVFEAAQRASG